MPLAGDFVRASDFAPGVGIGIPAYITKSGAETVTSSTTMQDDNDLTFTMEAGATYLVEVYINAQSASATPDIKTAWAGPADISGARWNVGTAVATTAGFVGREDSNGRFSVHGVTTVTSYALDTAGVSIQETGVISSATGGTFKVQWAQNTSSATATQVNASTFMTYTKIEV